MATIMLMHWREATAEQYDQVRAKIGWDRDVPDGAKLHVCGFADDGMHILDVWESEQAFSFSSSGSDRPSPRSVSEASRTSSSSRHTGSSRRAWAGPNR